MDDVALSSSDFVGEAQALQTYWSQRNTQMVLERSVVALDKPVAKKGNFNWTINAPKTLYDTTVALLSAVTPRIQLPLTINFTEEEREKISKAERFLLGIFRALEDRHYNAGRGSWLRELAYWVCSGWYAVQVIVHKPLPGKVEFWAELFDPMTVYPEWDQFGLKRFARVFQTDYFNAMAMAEYWGMKDSLKAYDPQAQVQVVNYWKRDMTDQGPAVYNGVSVGTTVLKPLQRESSFKRIPILTGSSTGSPDRSRPDWQQNMGESIIRANMDVYDYQNQILRKKAQLLDEMTGPDVVTKTKSGRPAVKKEDFGGGHRRIIPLAVGEEITPFRSVDLPPEINTLFTTLDGYAQRGGLPYAVYGNIPFELSGFAIAQLMAAIRYKAGPYANTLEMVLGKIACELIEQYRDGVFPAVKLATVNPLSQRRGIFFMEEFAKKDIPETTFVKVSIPLTSSMDRMQQIEFARRAMEPPQLLSRERLYDEVLDIQDTDQELARIMDDQTMELQGVKQIMVIQKIRELSTVAEVGGRLDEAGMLREYADMLVAQGSGAQNPNEAPAAKPKQAMPQAMPPEMGTRNPDVQRVIENRVPPRPRAKR